jgi:cytochrome c-type biogenesis protein CcmH
MRHGRPLLFALAVFALGAALAAAVRAASIAPKTSLDAVAEGLTCQCGCGLTVANCNHPQCEFAVPIRSQIEGMIARGKSRPEIIAWFRARYGEKVLSAPTTEGFNLLAWIMPFAALLGGGVGVFFVFSRWRAKAPDAPVNAGAFDPDLRRRLEKELRERL